MAGLLEWANSPAGIGLLSALATGAAGARRGQPWNSVGRGLVGGLAGYSQAQDAIKQDSENALTKRYREMQMQELESKIANQKALREAATGAYQDASKPAQFSVGGQSFPTQPEAQTSAESMFSLPSSAAPDSNQPLLSFQSGQQAPASIADFSGGQTPQVTQQQAPDVRSAMYTRLMQAGFPEEAAKYAPDTKPIVLGKTLINPATGKTIAVDSTWKEEQATARAQRIEELNMRLDDQRLNREQQMALRRELADQQAALRRDLAGQAAASRRDLITQGNKPPSGYRYTPDGNLEQIPGGPADLKRQAQLEGGGTVDSVVASLRDSYNKLDEGGGITSTNNLGGTNAGAWLGSTAIGQTAGSMFGTGNQKERDVIAQQRPLLLQAIMKATGMSAKQMDSNAELKLYLATATDPTKSLQANRQALDMIEKLYGSGAGNAPIAPGGRGNNQPDIPATKPAAMPKFGEVRNGFRFVGGKNASPNDQKNWKKVAP